MWKIEVLGFNSKGNCYALFNDEKAIIIEAGVSFKKVMQSPNNITSKDILCTLITHEHGDHSKYVKDFAKISKIVCTKGTLDKLEERGFDKYKSIVKVNDVDCDIDLDGVNIKSYRSYHDASDPCMFVITTNENKIAFITDTIKIDDTIDDDIDTFIIEANYKSSLLDKAVEEEITSEILADRIRGSHMEFNETITYLQDYNNFFKIKNVLLTHMSDNHSNHNMFLEEARNKLVGINVDIANEIHKTIEI